MTSIDKPKAAPAKTARRRSREFALQALYAWQIAQASTSDIIEQVKGYEGYERANAELTETLVRGVVDRSGELEKLIAPFLDRSFASLSPVERAILYIGTFELDTQMHTPFKVIVNEAIELGKSFGGTDGHKFVNGVLEKLAASLRPAEFATARGGPPQAAAEPQR
jgi:transcription antitermination protein NusB